MVLHEVFQHLYGASGRVVESTIWGLPVTWNFSDSVHLLDRSYSPSDSVNEDHELMIVMHTLMMFKQKAATSASRSG